MCKKYKLPTDREILKCIYEMYKSEYPKYIEGELIGKNDPYVPIDIWKIADKLNAQPELVFGRIYYHLNRKYSYRDDKDATVNLYILEFRDTNNYPIIKKSIHFPLLASILSGMNDEHSKYYYPFLISIGALIVSFAALLIK